MFKPILASLVLFVSVAVAQSDPERPAFPSDKSDYSDGAPDTEQLVFAWETGNNPQHAFVKIDSLTQQAYDAVNVSRGTRPTSPPSMSTLSLSTRYSTRIWFAIMSNMLIQTVQNSTVMQPQRARATSYWI